MGKVAEPSIGGGRVNHRFAAPAASLAIALSVLSVPAASRQHPAPPAPARVSPPAPLSATTQRSGGPLIAARAALRLRHADIAVEMLPERRMLRGVATLTLDTAAPQRELLLDLDPRFAVSAIRVDDRDLPAGSWRNPDGQLAMTLPRPLDAGENVRVRIAYAGAPHVARNPPWDDGFVWRQAEGRPWFGSTAQGYGCDLWWPCLDFPKGEPAAVDLHVTVPAGLVAPGNGVLVSETRLADGRTRFHWRSAAINPYDVAISVGPYRLLSGEYRSRHGNTVPLRFWHLPASAAKAPALFAEFAPTLDFFESVIGPYPFGGEKLGLVETPYLGMEHQTINAYGNGFKQAAEGFDWLFQHELSHEWFGNQMTAADWDDFWLHEGFGQYMQPLYGRWREGEARYAAMMQAQRERIVNASPIVSGRSRTSEQVYEVGQGGPGTDIYYKGAWVLHSLRNLIGDAAFFDATRRLVYGRPDPKPGNFRPRFATTAEFEALAAQAAGRDLRWFFDAYLRQAALPDLVATRHGDTLSLRWQVPGGAFPMPVEVSVDGVVTRVAMADGSATLPVPAAAHVVLDPMARVLRRSEAIERMQRDRAVKR